MLEHIIGGVVAAVLVIRAVAYLIGRFLIEVSDGESLDDVPFPLEKK